MDDLLGTLDYFTRAINAELSGIQPLPRPDQAITHIKVFDEDWDIDGYQLKDGEWHEIPLADKGGNNV